MRWIIEFFFFLRNFFFLPLLLPGDGSSILLNSYQTLIEPDGQGSRQLCGEFTIITIA